MIRHRPAGRGHPYLVEADQRYPVRPSTGAGFDLGTATSEDVRGLSLELERGRSRRVVSPALVGPATARELERWGETAGRAAAGHLAAAAAPASEAGVVAWTYAHEPLGPGETLRYRFMDDREQTEWFTVTGCAWSPSDALVVDAPASLRARVGPAEVLGDGALSFALRFSLRLESHEHVVGFGERFNGVDQRGRRVDNVVFDQYKRQGARSYLPMPFAIVVGGGFGFHLDTGRRARFDVGLDDPNELRIEIDLEPGVEEPRLRLRLYPGAPVEVLHALLDDVGRPAAPPGWVYRLWMSGNEWNTQERILHEVDRSEAEGIAVGAVVIEAWSDEETFVAFRGGGAWPDPKGLVDELHRRDIRVLLWQIPLARRDAGGEAARDADLMIERGYCVHDASGEPYGNPGGWFENALLLDWTNPEAAEWWTGKRRYLLDEVRIDGFKTDGGEHAWAADLRYHDGSRGGETNNRYPVLYAHAYHRLMRESGRAPFTFSRAGYTGSQSAPGHWAGDEDSTWEALRASITAGISASACGIFFWSFDLAGFSGPLPPPELYLRAAAVGAFAPIMQYHSEFNFHRSPSRDRTPWNVAEQTGDPGVVPLFRRLVQLRERLVPYLVEQGERAIATSLPLMRGLFFTSDDERLWDFPYQYLLGDDILVAPVVEPGVRRLDVFVPAGHWLDPWSGDEVAGARVVRVDAPVGAIPVLVSARAAGRLMPAFDAVRDQLVEVA
jgi:alpha-glucosidase (family GH31 glycosyl hydrolase)